MLGRFSMKHITLCLGLALMVLAAGCSSSMTSESFVRTGYNFSQINNVAIIDVVGAVTSDSAKAQIADEFSKQLMQKGFAPVQRDYIQRLLRDNGFTNEGLSPEAYAIEVGRLLGYKAVMIVNLPNFDYEASITAKILEAQDGSALWIASGSTELPAKPIDLMPSDPFANFGQPSAPMESLDNNEPLSSGERRALGRLIERMCRSLPDRNQVWMVAAETVSPGTSKVVEQPVVREPRCYNEPKKIPVLWDLWPGNWGK